MKSPEGKIVELMLVTGDDVLAADFVSELEERDTSNPVLRFPTYQASTEHLESMGGASAGRTSQIIILDLRPDPREGIRFLNEVHDRHPFSEPVVFLIGAGDHEGGILKRHERFIAGQLPETGAGAAFVEWAASMLSENWSFEERRSET